MTFKKISYLHNKYKIFKSPYSIINIDKLFIISIVFCIFTLMSFFVKSPIDKIFFIYGEESVISGGSIHKKYYYAVNLLFLFISSWIIQVLSMIFYIINGGKIYFNNKEFLSKLNMFLNIVIACLIPTSIFSVSFYSKISCFYYYFIFSASNLMVLCLITMIEDVEVFFGYELIMFLYIVFKIKYEILIKNIILMLGIFLVFCLVNNLYIPIYLKNTKFELFSKFSSKEIISCKLFNNVKKLFAWKISVFSGVISCTVFYSFFYSIISSYKFIYIYKNILMIIIEFFIIFVSQFMTISYKDIYSQLSDMNCIIIGIKPKYYFIFIVTIFVLSSVLSVLFFNFLIINSYFLLFSLDVAALYILSSCLCGIVKNIII